MTALIARKALRRHPRVAARWFGVGPGGCFLGDYEGLTSTGTNVESFVSTPTATDPDNTYLATIAPQP